MGERFSCTECSRCCNSTLFSRGEAKNQQDGKVAAEEKGPVYTNAGAVGLPVLDFEKVEMEGEAKRLGIETSFAPEKFCFDSLTRTKIVASWKLEGSPCPFLSKKNRCTIYPKRPFICRHFPIMMKNNKAFYAKECSSLKQEKVKKLLSGQKNTKGFFSEQLAELQKKLGAIEAINNLLGRLSAQGKVSYAFEETQEQLSEKWPQQKTQSLFEFIEAKNLGSKNHAKSM